MPPPPPPLKDSERGGREGSEMRLDTLCCSAGELCRFSLERSSTWDRVTHRRHSQPTGTAAEAQRRLADQEAPWLRAHHPIAPTNHCNQTISPAPSVEGKQEEGSICRV